MPENYYMYFITALLPLVVGAIFYNPKVMGNTWMKVNGFKEDDLKGGNMLMIFGLSYLYGIMLSLAFGYVVVHQTGVFQTMMPDILESGSQAQTEFNNLMASYGNNFRTFGHGAVHGLIFSVLFVLPVIAINAMFERRGWKYIGIHFIYWLITLVLIGGVLSKTLTWASL